MDPALTTVLITAASVLGVREVVGGLIAWAQGRPDRERRRVQDLEDDRADALAEADRLRVERDSEASRRRRIEEHASALRRLLIDAGHTDVPRWPY